MSDTNFKAQNELEKILLNVLDGQMEGENFLEYMMNAQVFMPISDQTHALKGFQRTTGAQPLLAEDEDNNQVLILFTSSARSQEFVQDFPGYEGGLLTEFSQVLRKLDTAINIELNPGLEAGFDMDAETVASMMAQLPPELQ